MKKHFLILMLMALLPLAGWAAAADLLTKPSLATGLIYNGNAQNLTTGDYALPADYDLAQGGVLWNVTTTDEAPTSGGELNAVATNAGTYYVWYKVLKDNSMYDEDGVWTKLTTGGSFARISKATPEVDAPVGADLTYTGEAQQLIATASEITSGATASVVEYSLDENHWYADIDNVNLKKTDANTAGYAVYYRVSASADGNWKAFADQIVVPIAKATPEITPPVGKTGLVYNKTYILVETAGSVTKGEGVINYSFNEDMSGSTTDATSSTTTIKKGKAGTYKVYYQLPASNNYAATEVEYIEVTIAPCDISVENANLAFTNVPEASVVYDGTEKTTTPAFTYKGYARTLGTDFTQTYEGDRVNVTADGFTTVITGKGNFTGTKSWNTKITGKDISGTVTVGATLDDAQDYTGSKIEPSTEGLLQDETNVLVEGTDYDVTYGTTGENAKDNKNVAKGGAIVIAFKGNYTGTKTVNFDIKKVNLTVTAQDNEKFYGEADPTVQYGITGWLAGEETITGTATFTRTPGEDKGTYTWAYGNGLTAANYNFVSDAAENQGKLTIKSNQVAITVTDATETYGYKLPTLDKTAFAYYADGLGTLASIASMEFVVTDADENEYDAGDMLEVGTYTITAKNAVASPVSAAEFSYTAGTLTIEQKTVVITTKDQKVDYAATPWKIVSGNTSDTYVTIKDSEGNDIDFNGVYSIADAKAYFIDALTWDAEAATLANPGEIGVALDENYSSKNFDVEIVKGKVQFTGAGTTIEIVRLSSAEAEDATPVADKLNEFNGVEQIVTIKAKTAETTEAFRVMKADRWYAMVLPFNTSVREIAAAFGGYAVVDIFDETSTLTDDVKFKLHVGPIEANKPFILKLDEDLDLFAHPATFAAHQIVYSTDPTAATADKSAKFVGKYDGKEGFDDADGHQYVFSLSTGSISNTKSTTYIPPMSAYIWMENQMNGMSKAREIIIEEPDGSTTTISTINADGTVNAEGWYNLNGIKQNAPAQKGVYIQNGKKLVVK